MAVGVFTSNLSVDADVPSSERAVGLSGCIRIPGVFVFRIGEADLFRDETLVIDAGRSSSISVVPSWRARERVVALDEGVGGGGMFGGPREAERVLLRSMGSGFSGLSSDFCLFGGMVGVEVSWRSGSIEWATRWAEHFTVDLVKTLLELLDREMGEEGNKVTRRKWAQQDIFYLRVSEFPVINRLGHHFILSSARLSKFSEVMLVYFFVYLQSLYATDRLFQPLSLNDGLLAFMMIHRQERNSQNNKSSNHRNL